MANKESISKGEEAEIVKMLTVEPGADLAAPELRRAAIETLEGGGIIYLPKSGFELSGREQELISDPAKILTQVPDVEDGRPTIIYDPAHGRIKKYHYAQVRGKMMRAKVRDTACTDIETAMARYGEWAEDVITQLFPSYREGLDANESPIGLFHVIARNRCTSTRATGILRRGVACCASSPTSIPSTGRASGS